MLEPPLASPFQGNYFMAVKVRHKRNKDTCKWKILKKGDASGCGNNSEPLKDTRYRNSFILNVNNINIYRTLSMIIN